ncbi:hypothetical protein [Cellulosimicrobium protaetiae]|uniref:Uncharacterized protein n=1 Tax=Cellulosimicrobium protaetiae TaxID=2587808 RepID=A0A6M5UCV6_9MICO|nr:hypothetical protein [Cellulosimicrobium protaetiae]QJW34993.1 hypothetical protein FIC82_001025 [Cellulosimicrobium protaetiae]
MSPATGNPAPTPPEDDFLARLRRTADDAVPPSTLDLDVVLRSSRRGVRRRRSFAGVAGVVALGLVGTGVVTAGGPGGLRELAREVVTGSPGYEVVTAEATLVDVAPGVVAVSEPAAYLREDDTYVLDLGLPAWDGDDRFLVEAGVVNDLGHLTTDVTLRVGDDDDLAALRAGRPAGTVVDDGSHSVVVDPASGRTLVVGVMPDGALVGTATTRSFLGLTGEVTDTAGVRATTLELPTAQVQDGSLVDFEVYAAVLGGDGTPLPDVRGYLGFTEFEHMYATCSPPAPDRPDSEACAVRYDAATGRVEADRDYPTVTADPVLDALRAEVAGLDDPLAAPDLLTPCLEARGIADPWSSDVRPTGEGPRADAWRRCLLDATEVGVLGRA